MSALPTLAVRVALDPHGREERRFDGGQCRTEAPYHYLFAGRYAEMHGIGPVR